MTNPLLDLEAKGQSIWLDYLHQKILNDGELKRLIEQDGLKGLTSNPSIFEKAIGGGGDYDARLKVVIDGGDANVTTLYESLAIADIQAAADQFRPVYDRLNGADGYASLEVSPYLAMDMQGTIAEARRLWRAVNRPNVMIKAPGTKAGAPAIRQLISEGVNINVTLLFGIADYLDVAEAYMAGLEAFKANGGDIAKVHSVASFFLSRIDVEIGKKIERDPSAARAALRGKVAIASAKIAYQHYLRLLDTPRWKALAAAGATPQRLLWASTGTKDPSLPDTLYVAELIGPDTINTMPPQTMDAFRDHGRVGETLTQGIDEARAVLAQTDALGFDLKSVTDGLVTEGVALFHKAFDGLLGAVAQKRAAILGARLNTQALHIPPALEPAYKETLARASAEAWSQRLWGKDSTLWTRADEAKWLGWLRSGDDDMDIGALVELQRQVKAEGFTHALLMGMGGSSLGAEVFAATFAPKEGFPRLIVLDSTDAAQVARAEAEIDPARTLFIVSSKSGSTLEPNILCDYFYARAQEALGRAPGDRFIAITDPGSSLAARAAKEAFRRVFPGDPETGGRYSVLSNFGMVPAAIIGLDVAPFSKTTQTMKRTCGADASAPFNPGIELGVLLSVAAKAGRDKVTIFTSDPISDLGAWLEQLLAESTGKHGKGLIPVDDEPMGSPAVYGDDRIFVSFELTGANAGVEALVAAGHPVVRIALASPDLLGQEFCRWEIAVAIAGAVIGINPFDQPDVEASKVKTRALTDAYEAKGALAAQTPIARRDGMALYSDARNAEALAQAADDDSVAAYLRAHLRRAHAGDYIGFLAYLDRSTEHRALMRDLRRRVRDRMKLATIGGFGPRFLHSTGQAYKGGPNTGVFLQITAAPAHDLAIPGRSASFGVVEAAQAQGDFDVLAERGRRVLRVDLGADIEGGLKRLTEMVNQAAAGGA